MPFGVSKATVGIKFFSREWEKWIHETHEKLKKRRYTNAKCTAYIGKWIQDNFKSEGSLVGDGWKPLSDLTIAMRRNKGRASTRILQDTGNLKNRWKRFYTDEDAYIESGVDYGWKHELSDPHNTWNGYPAPIPKRKILPTKKHVWPGIQKIYKLFLGKVLK